MTRFARAKGSKASNERVPEEATPWQEMKQQILIKNQELENRILKKEFDEEKRANYKAFLKEREEEQIGKEQWADIPGNVSQKSMNNERNIEELSDDGGMPEKSADQIKNEETSDDDGPPMEVSCKVEVKVPEVKIKKIRNRNKKISIPLKIDKTESEKDMDTVKVKPAKRKIEEETVQDGPKKKRKGKSQEKNQSQPKKNTSKKTLKEDLSEKDLKKIEKKKQKRIKQVMKKQKYKEELKKEVVDNAKTLENEQALKKNNASKIVNKSNNLDNSKNNNKHKKKFGDSDQDKVKRGKKFKPEVLHVNGKKLEISYIEGFPVKKEDAERIQKLKREMIGKGLPQSQIKAALKLERRRAEKALAREKKMVCFNCRKSGHNLSDCPELGKDQIVQTAGSGICFKCGSTEHTHFQCKVAKGEGYKFAQCFICNEQGHIAKQCPDNARGIYPKGGACRVCGDVTHLKKDCPQYQAQQQSMENSLSGEVLGVNSNPDVINHKNGENVKIINAPRKNKIIKFD